MAEQNRDVLISGDLIKTTKTTPTKSDNIDIKNCLNIENIETDLTSQNTGINKNNKINTNKQMTITNVSDKRQKQMKRKQKNDNQINHIEKDNIIKYPNKSKRQKIIDEMTLSNISKSSSNGRINKLSANSKENLENLLITSTSTSEKQTKKCKIQKNKIINMKDEETLKLQKLNGLVEKLRQQNAELLISLTHEKNAIKSLKARSEAENRRAKVESKKLQIDLQQTQNNNVKKILKMDSSMEITKLNKEISILKETIKTLEKKNQISSESERRASSDLREQKDMYELRLTQATKSAKSEINRLMRKLQDSERKNCKTKNIQISTTCGDEFSSIPHEIQERILESHNEHHICRRKDHILNSDTDSALSSATSSLSPQPNCCSNSPDVWKMLPKESGYIYQIQDDLAAENNSLKYEISTANKQIMDLEEALREIKGGCKIEQLREKIKYLEEKEVNFIKDTHELREQNELLEFRIIELEESHDKWSLRSNSTIDARDVWMDTEIKRDEIMLLERCDSGITSPHSHDDCQRVSPCDLSIDQIQQDDVRKRLLSMSKRPNYDSEDKLCILQILSLLNNLEALSQDQEINGNEPSLNINLTRQKSSTELITSKYLPQNNPKNQNRIVATVLPYSSGDDSRIRCSSNSSLVHDSPKKAKFWSSTSLQESGVFEGDLTDYLTQSTQTEPDDFLCLDKPVSNDLTAEIQKLNKFRERIEECVIRTNSKPEVVSIISTESLEQRRLQYYIERLELLENKILIYESSGDIQMRRLADRLQREIQLEGLVKQLTEKLDKFINDNQRLEEEKCEFEEAENDTRLRLQQLEFDLEILNQRNSELEMTRKTLKSKMEETEHRNNCLENILSKNQDRIFCLEEHEIELKHRFEMVTKILPILLFFNKWNIKKNQNKSQENNNNNNVTTIYMDQINNNNNNNNKSKLHLEERFQECKNREKELIKNITELNKAYNETLENADNLWATMEKDYKDRLTKAKDTELALKCKLLQLEECLKNDTQFAQEKLLQLEETEENLKERIYKLNKNNKDLLAKHDALLDETNNLRDEHYKLKLYLDGTITEQLEKDKNKIKELQEELSISTKMLNDVGEIYKKEINIIRNQLGKANKEVIHIEITNGELKEEIFTLESQICHLNKQHKQDEENINHLTSELIYGLNQLAQLQSKIPEKYQQSLAQEMEPSILHNNTIEQDIRDGDDAIPI